MNLSPFLLGAERLGMSSYPKMIGLLKIEADLGDLGSGLGATLSQLFGPENELMMAGDILLIIGVHSFKCTVLGWDDFDGLHVGSWNWRWT